AESPPTLPHTGSRPRSRCRVGHFRPPEVGNFQPPLTTSRDSGASVAWRSLFDVVPSRGSGRLGGRLRAPRLCCGARPRNLRDPGHVNGGYTPGCVKAGLELDGFTGLDFDTP